MTNPRNDMRDLDKTSRATYDKDRCLECGIELFGERKGIYTPRINAVLCQKCHRKYINYRRKKEKNNVA